MLKNHLYKILFCLTTLGITSLQAAHLLQQEGKNDDQETDIGAELTPRYYNYTVKHYNKRIDNTVPPDELKEEKQYLRDTHIPDTLKNKKGAIFFMVIVSNHKPKALSKFFFINRAPNTAQNAIKRLQRSCGCHVISHHKPRLSPHIVFQLLG